MRELQRRGVQKETFKTGSRFGKLLIKLTVAVAIVERNRVTGILGMYANLMRTARDRATAHQRGEGIALFHLEARF